MSFSYHVRLSPILQGLNFDIVKGSRTALIGVNGCGKSTLLRMMAGKTYFDENKQDLTIFGYRCYHDNKLNEIVSFVGDKWKQSGDVKVAKLIETTVEMDESISAERVLECVNALDIDVNWRYHLCSQGEQRRIQLLMSLLKPFECLLLDEVTVDLDVAVRFNFLNWLKKESVEKNATIILATHVYDGIDTWASHVMRLEQDGRNVEVYPIMDLPGYHALYSDLTVRSPFFVLIQEWMTSQWREKKKKREESIAQGGSLYSSTDFLDWQYLTGNSRSDNLPGGKNSAEAIQARIERTNKIRKIVAERLLEREEELNILKATTK